MSHKVAFPLSRQIQSDASIVLMSMVFGLVVFSAAILLQWLVYDDWLHRNGPMRLVGSALSGILTFLFAHRRQQAKRAEKVDVLKRFEMIRRMNDRIRNSLQMIECVVFATNPHVTDPVRDAVDSIEGVLQEMLIPYSVPSQNEEFQESESAKPVS